MFEKHSEILTTEVFRRNVVNHKTDFARKVAHRVIFMDQGSIIEDATKDDFFGEPRSERGAAVLIEDTAS